MSHCRFCNAPLTHTVVDLGRSPLANSYLSAATAAGPEQHFPLHVKVCDSCLLVQLEAFKNPENIFSDYLYFSSFSTLWLEHCQMFALAITQKLHLGSHSKVVEIASNDGYLLQYFKNQGIPVLGVEPAANVAKEAQLKGIDTHVAFFGTESAKSLAANTGKADLICANNVLAHVPDINDFVAGFKMMLKSDGVITVEFPHLLNLIELVQFDTIYHEHFSYLSLKVVEAVFNHHGLNVFDVEELWTHGGSLRVYACHAEDRSKVRTPSVDAILAQEQAQGLFKIETYQAFSEAVVNVKLELLTFLIDARKNGWTVVGYGAPAKGNTLLNYCGIGPELLSYTVDRSPHKQGLMLPGVQIPIHSPDMILATQPDYVLILPWNIKDEIMKQMEAIRTWGGKFVTAVPRFEIY